MARSWTIEDLRRQMKDQPNGCLTWNGRAKLDAKGYAHLSVNGRMVYLHRLLWEDQRGPIPKGLVLHHRCENRACANIDHLQLVTRGEHLKLHPYGQERGRQSPKRWQACKRGHPITPENILVTAPTQRYCKTCRREYVRRYEREHPRGPRKRQRR